MKEAFTSQKHSEFRAPAPEARAGTVFRLTKPIETPRLDRGALPMERVIFMPEIAAGEPRQVQPEGRPANLNALASEQARQSLHHAWEATLTADERKNPDTMSTVKMIVDMGIAPTQVTSKGEARITAREVVANSTITGKDREEEKRLRASAAAKVIGRILTPVESEALMQAHEEAAGEDGKDGKKASSGVFNYTPEQLLRKIRKLRQPLDNEGKSLKDAEGNPIKEVFNEEERRMLIEAGLAATPIPDAELAERFATWNIDEPIDGHDLTAYPDLHEIARKLRVMARGQVLDAREIMEQERAVRKLLTEPGSTITPDISAAFMKKLSELTSSGTRTAADQNRYMYLQESEKQKLRKNPKLWLNQKIDEAVRASSQGQGFNDQLLNQLQSKIQNATEDLNELGRYKESVELEEIFNTQYNLMVMNATVGAGNIEHMEGAATRLRARGVMLGMSLNEGSVRYMFNRITRSFQDNRLADGGLERYLSPTIVAASREDILNQEYKLAKESKGFFGSFYNGEAERLSQMEENRLQGESVAAARDRITRERIASTYVTAYNEAVGTGNVGVISSRGTHLSGLSAYYSDVMSAFSPYNSPMFGYEKWNSLEVEQQNLVQRIKLDMADVKLAERGYDPKKIDVLQREALGDRLFKEWYTVPDFFSSGWRIEGMTKQLERVTEYKMQNVALATRVLSAKNASKIGEFTVQFETYYIEKYGNDALTKLQEDTGKYEKKRALFALTHMSREDRDKILKEELTDAEKEAINKESKTRAGDMSLYLQMKSMGYSNPADRDSEDPKKRAGWQKRIDLWQKKIAVYRTDEMVQIFRERASSEQAFIQLMNQAPFSTQELPKGLDKNPFLDEHGHPKSHGVTLESAQQAYDQRIAEARFDAFKKKYSGAITYMREIGYRDDVPRQINFNNLSAADRAALNSLIGEAEAGQLVSGFGVMKNFIDTASVPDAYNRNLQRGVVDTFVEDLRFYDFYARTWSADDTLLDELEVVPENAGFLRMSERFASDQRTDPMARFIRDTAAAKKAEAAFMTFLQGHKIEDRMKAAVEMSHAVADYNGQGAKAEIMQYTMGTYLGLSKVGWIWDSVGISKLPFEWSVSEIEKIMGPAAETVSQEKLRHLFNEMRTHLAANADYETEEEKLLYSLKERKERREDHEKKAEALLKFMEKKWGIHWKDVVKMRAMGVFWFLLLSVIIDVPKSMEFENIAKG